MSLELRVGGKDELAEKDTSCPNAKLEPTKR